MIEESEQSNLSFDLHHFSRKQRTHVPSDQSIDQSIFQQKQKHVSIRRIDKWKNQRRERESLKALLILPKLSIHPSMFSHPRFPPILCCFVWMLSRKSSTLVFIRLTVIFFLLMILIATSLPVISCFATWTKNHINHTRQAINISVKFFNLIILQFFFQSILWYLWLIDCLFVYIWLCQKHRLPM